MPMHTHMPMHMHIPMPTCACALQAGETTLEGEIARLTMRSMASGEGLGFLGSLQQVGEGEGEGQGCGP